MKIYAIRDRLIDYYMQPFSGPDDKPVLQAIAIQVNSETATQISQSPHHYEVWRLGEVTETGDLIPNKEFLADCSSLVRTSVRKDAAWQPGMYPVPEPQISGRTAPRGPNGLTDAQTGATTGETPSTDRQGKKAPGTTATGA